MATQPVFLYLGDIDAGVDDAQLLDLFRQIGDVVSVRICRDSTGMSLGYGYVNYGNSQNAERALEEQNLIPLNGKPIRVMYSNGDPTARRSDNANIFIKNLDKEIDNKKLYQTFSTFGDIIACKVATDLSGQSKGYGYVQYESVESARLAIEKLNGELLNGKHVYVGPLVRKEEREMAANRLTFTNVFVKNLLGSVTEDDLKKIFGEFGSITSAVVMKKEDGTSKCFGFVNFENPNDAARAVETLDGKVFHGKAWFVGKALKKSERELELRRRSEQVAEDAASNLNDMGGLPEMSQPILTGAYGSALRNYAANKRRTMLNGTLYPLIKRLEPGYTMSVLCLLLEMDKAEILHLIESPDALEAKVNEAMEVLKAESVIK